MEFWFRFGWFSLGLAIGLLLLSWYHLQLQFKLKRLTRDLKPEALNWSLSSTSRLTRAISARLAAQRDLKQQLDTHLQIFQTAPIGFLQVDEENQLLWCNAQACQLLSMQLSQPSRPRLLLELVRSYELDELIEQTRAAAQPCTRDWLFHPVSADQPTLSQQQSLPLRGYGLPLLHGSVGVFLESRQEAVLLAQQRDRWTSDVAHELKTPLTSIRLVAEMLQSRTEPPLRNWVDRLLQETIRLSSLVQDLLDLSQLESRPAPTLNLRAVDLNQLIDSAWASLEPIARRKHLQLDYMSPGAVILQADELRLHRVLLNLLDNSIKYSPPHAAIHVRLSLPSPGIEPAQVCLDVIDAGPGFPETALPHVFERFYRADLSRSRGRETELSAMPFEPELNQTVPTKPLRDETALFTMASPSLPSSGSGLGLAIVRQIVEAHHGSVRAQNHPETHGAWLQVLLPYPSSGATQANG